MESAAQSIVSKFGQVLVEELQEIRGVGDKVVHLRDELATMNAALRLISEAEQSSVDHLVREWEKQVHDLVYDAEDCADTYSLRIVRPIPRPPNDVARYLLARAKGIARYHYEKLVLQRAHPRSLAPARDIVGAPLVFSWAGYLLARAKQVARYPYEKLVLQCTLAADIKALLARTTIISERRVRYGIDRTTLPRAAFLAPISATSISANALHPADDPDQFVGIREQANDLSDKIKGIKAPIHDQRDKIKPSVRDEDDKIEVEVIDQDDKMKAPVHDHHDKIKAHDHDHIHHDKIKPTVDDEDDKIKAPVHDENDKSLKVFSIVGFGGLGKTTLAMELCRQLDADFPCQALVSVSQAFDVEKDMKGLLVRVLKQMQKEKADAKAKQTTKEEEVVGQIDMTNVDDLSSKIKELFDHKIQKEKADAKAKQTTKEEEVVGQIDMTNVDDLSSMIKELLDHKRYLIVVDDVWSLPAWEAIRSRLPENNCGSRIIVTTRIEAVAKAASASEYFVHHMKPLELEASEKMFVKRVFGSKEEDTCPSGLEEHMKKILKKCGGLPLAIVSIASLLASYRSVEDTVMWERVSRSIGSQMESHPTLEGMRQLITLSYDYLPHHLKACLMYLSIFPEDYVIVKDRLLFRWIAEGLVTEKRGLTLLEVAEEYLNELISRNMIQLVKFVSTKSFYSREVDVEGCRVHDMILEVMVSKSQESNFVSLVGRQYGGMPHGHGKVRRLSIHDNDHEEQHHARHGIETMNLQHVRSLTTFQRYGLDKLLNRLGEFKLLRVLDLEDCKALRNKHMRDVCRLYLLRFLSLRGTRVSKMPRKVGNLEHLETLDVTDMYIGRRLPQTVTKLSKLECLRSHGWLLPRGLGNMKTLREVDMGVLDGRDVSSVAREIGKLTRLQVLSIEIGKHIDGGCLPELASSLSKTSTLRSLILGHRSSGNLDFLLGVTTPPPLLQRLGMYGSISQLPNWISSLIHLTKFEIGHTKLAGDQLFGVLCKLPNLQSVQLLENTYKDEELVARPEHSFPVLRILKVYFSSLYVFPTVLTFKEGSMTKLETLVLVFNHEKMSVVGVENLENLKEVKLCGRKGNPAMERVVKQLKTHPKSNQIKVVADWY